MTVPCTGWRVVAEVTANQSSAACFAPDGGLFRIITVDRQLTTPNYPTMGTAGLLITRPTLAHIVAGRGVRMAPLSGAA